MSIYTWHFFWFLIGGGLWGSVGYLLGRSAGRHEMQQLFAVVSNIPDPNEMQRLKDTK